MSMRESYTMTAQLCPKKFTQAVDDVCESLGIVGDDIRSHLKREIPSKVLFRRASDVVLLSGHTGTGECPHARPRQAKTEGPAVAHPLA